MSKNTIKTISECYSDMTSQPNWWKKAGLKNRQYATICKIAHPSHKKMREHLTAFGYTFVEEERWVYNEPEMEGTSNE